VTVAEFGVHGAEASVVKVKLVIFGVEYGAISSKDGLIAI